MGLYGCGARTNVLVDSVYQDNLVKVVSCYDLDKERREKTAKKYSAVPVDNLEKLISNKQVDAFLISLPPKFHAQSAAEVSQAGKPIFLEKPVATNLEDGKKLVARIKETGIVCRVGFAHRYVPVFKKVTEIIRSGKLGKTTGMTNDWISRFAPDWKEMLEMRDWRLDPETGGQVVYHYCHFFDLLRVWFGEVISVRAATNHLLFPMSPSENEIFATLEFENGALADLHFSEVSYRSDMLGRIEGEKATLEYEWNENSIIRFYYEPGSRKPNDILNGFSPDIQNREIMEDFVREAKGEQPVQVTVEDGLIVLKIAIAIRLSAKEGRKVYLSEV